MANTWGKSVDSGRFYFLRLQNHCRWWLSSIYSFSLAAFNIFPLYSVFVSLTNMCLIVFLLGFILYETLCASQIWVVISFPMLRRFSFIIFWNSFSGPYFLFSSVHFTSVAHLCPNLCDPMNRSTTGLPVHHQLLEFTQIHVHRVGDAIQPSHSLSSPSSPTPNPSQKQGLFQWINSSQEVAKVLEFQL